MTTSAREVAMKCAEICQEHADRNDYGAGGAMACRDRIRAYAATLPDTTNAAPQVPKTRNKHCDAECASEPAASAPDAQELVKRLRSW